MINNGSSIVAVCETSSDGRIKNVSKEIISEGKRLAEITGESLTALVSTDKSLDFNDLYRCGADKIVVIKKERDDYFDVEADSFLFSQAITDIKPSIVLFGATDYGRIVAPKVAALCRCGITADCTAFDINENGKLIQIRPALGGNILAHIISPEKMPQMASVRPSVFKALENFTDKGSLEEISIALPKHRKIVKELERVVLESKEEGKIENANIIVSAGYGIKSKDLLDQVYRFAQLIGGAAGCSRRLVDSGWMSHSRQVGQSGKTVSPDIYIAIGISGASQHLAGMKTSAKIIAVNSDSNAEIFSVADIGFVMDAGVWLKKSIELLERNL